MRFAVGSLTSAVVLFVAAAIGAVGAWALPVSAFALLMSAVIGAKRLVGYQAPVEEPVTLVTAGLDGEAA
jgi:hypothetical protein